MLRISVHSGAGRRTLQLEGKLTDENVARFLEAVQNELREFTDVDVDLQHVSFMDVAGAYALREALHSGAVVHHCPGFVTALLRSLGLD